MNIKVLLQAFNSVWFIEPNAAEHYSLIAHQLLIGERKSFFDDEDDEEDAEEYAFAVDATGKRIGSVDDAVENGVAVINLRGAVMKYDYCGSPGTQSLKNALQQANDNPGISAILFQIDSPGGSVDGTEQLASAIKNSDKPVVAFINGMMCSAAMWIGSSASQRIASSSTDTIGSIGTMAAWKDFSAYYDRLGIKSHEVYASASTQKNLPFREAHGKNTEGKTNYEPLIKTWLDPTNETFMNAIQDNLPAADKTVLNGASYIASDAKKKGLIDKVGTFHEAVNTALKLGKQKQKTQTSYSMKFPKLSALLNFKAEEKVEAIQLEEGGQSLEAVITERDQLKLDNEQLNQKVTAHETTIGANNKKIQELNERITELEALDAGKPATTSEAADPAPLTQDVKAEDMAFQQELNSKI